MSEMFELRRASAEDLEDIVALDRETELAPHWPRSAYVAILDGSGSKSCLIVAQQEGAIWGFAVGSVAGDHGGTAEVETLAVQESARRQGLGRALCIAVLEWCMSKGAAEVALEVRAANAAAMGLYESLGFEREGRRPRYYANPEDDAVLMRLAIK
jgi:ribosomal-protein-alanine N-acetyltransferase